LGLGRGVGTALKGMLTFHVNQLRGRLIDIVFIDADKPGYLDYFQEVSHLCAPEGVILAHNISDCQSNPPYIDAETNNPDHDTLLVNGWMAVTIKKR
jgi:caffeoyl-CoA O-methyltransferase